MAMDIEELRKDYKPYPIGLLFVGESPPRENFFYSRKGPLYSAIREGFRRICDVEGDFLSSFKRECYLVDLLETRGLVLGKASQDEVAKGKKRLEALIRESRPRKVISVLKRRGKLPAIIKEAIDSSGVDVKFYALPFPSFHRKDFIEGLEKILTSDL